MNLPTPFIPRSSVMPSIPIPLLVVGYPVPAPTIDNHKLVDEYRVVLGLGRGLDARVASVAAALFYTDPVSFRDVQCLASYGGKLIVLHSIADHDSDVRIEKLHESARTAIGRGLIGDVWGIELYDFHNGELDSPADHPSWLRELASAVDAALTLFAHHINPWPKDAWTLSGGTP